MTDLAAASSLVERDRWHLARPTQRIPLVIDRGYGATLVDVDGREVIDLTSGWNVANTGWNDRRIIDAVRHQLDETAFAPPWCTHRGRIDYAARIGHWLGDRVGGEWRAWSGAGGSEAVEAALKIARRATGRHAVVGFEHAYHGGTLGAMLAGGVPDLQGVDLPRNELHRHAPIPDPLRSDGRDYADIARRTIMADPLPAAVLLEPVFTNPGVLAGDRAFHRAVAEATTEVGALLIVDEIGTGYGRTGRRFGLEHAGVQPDLVVVGKAMASGVVPMSAALMRSELADAVTGPGFSATFGWTPLACAAAIATLDVIESDGLVERSRELGDRALARLEPLRALPHVADLRGWGLEIGIELAEADGTRLPVREMVELCNRLLARGVFAEGSSYTSTLLVMPPLVIGEPQLDDALRVVHDEVGLLR